MDEDGEIKIPINGGKHLGGINYVGSHIKNYDSMLMLSHFKGHIMGGFGGALKKFVVLNDIDKEMLKRNIYQGDLV